MRDLLGWNLYLGHVAGIQFRLHALFVLTALLALLGDAADEGGQPRWLVPAALGALLSAAIVHEAGHSWAAQRLGGHTEVWNLSPLGGLSFPTLPRLPFYELRVAAAGPLSNLLVCLALAPALWLAGVGPAEVTHPFAPPLEGAAGTVWDALKLLFWCNWLLALVNLLPAQPLDGARMYRAILWQLVGLRSAAIRLAKLAQVAAIVLGATAWAIHDDLPQAALWCAGLACLTFFCSRQETASLYEPEQSEQAPRGEFVSGGVAVKRQIEPTARPQRLGLLRRWLAHRRLQRQVRERRQAEADEQRLDEILSRLHQRGPASLTDEDRAVLERSSARYRNRSGG